MEIFSMYIRILRPYQNKPRMKIKRLSPESLFNAFGIGYQELSARYSNNFTLNVTASTE